MIWRPLTAPDGRGSEKPVSATTLGIGYGYWLASGRRLKPSLQAEARATKKPFQYHSMPLTESILP
jgi:hypothetical protein